MKFSLLIANYNNGKFFKDCYESLLQQTEQDFEVIIVDDGSTDDSIQIIRELTAGDERFKLFQNETNQGCGFTKRKCAELASSPISAFVDPDDIIYPKALELMISVHHENPNASLVHSKWERLDANLKPIGKYKRAKQVTRTQDFLNIHGEISVFASYKNSFYKKTEGIDAKLPRAVDIDLYHKLYEVGETVFLDEFLYGYRIHEGGISTQQNVQKANYWRWVTNMKAAERRGINIEDKFVQELARRKELEMYKRKYYALKKFEPINNRYQKIRKYLP